MELTKLLIRKSLEDLGATEDLITEILEALDAVYELGRREALPINDLEE